MSLIDTIKDIQRELGVEVDGRFGPVTAANVLAELRNRHLDADAGKTAPAKSSETFTFDVRTEANLATLDPKAVPLFRRFIALAKATAATLGCDYVMTGGNRSYEEQDELYKQGRSKPGVRVTNARGGESNHNFAIAADFSVFQGKIWLEADDDEGGTKARRALAAKVHKACSMSAAECGLEWGGSWSSIVDQPHYQVATGKQLPQLRSLFEKKGSVL